MSSVSISAAFDSGNIEVVDIKDGCIALNIRDEPFTVSENRQHKQWFHFRALGVKDVECVYTILNAHDCSFPDAWPGFNICASYDRSFWFRVPGSYEDGKLTWSLKSEHSEVYFALFVPYSQERHLDLISKVSASDRAIVRSIGKTLDGRDLDLLVFGTGPLKIWAIARQHPGESMAEWWMDGYINRLLDPVDAVVRKLLNEATFYVIPNMNPDGSVRGHLRTNACGANLNREWANSGIYKAPTLERSPEVFHALREIDAAGCDMFIDVHGEEELGMNFIAGLEGIPSWGPRLQDLQSKFLSILVEVNPDMQSKPGYDIPGPEGANLAVCSNQIGQRFDCLSFTLEMPFKDTSYDPEPVQEWSNERSQRLGASFLDSILRVLPDLRSSE